MLKLLIYLCKNLVFFALHIKENGNFPPPLKAKEEAELLIKSRNGNIAARNKLIEHNLRLVMHIVKKYYYKDTEIDDLVSIGTIGLIKGIETYKPEKGNRLATYCARCIENEVLMHFRKNRKNERNVYIFDSIDTDKDGNALTYSDILTDNTDVIEQIDEKIKLSKLSGFLDTLDEREKKIISYRFGVLGANELTQQEIADKMGISRSYVSRIEKSALKKLREKF